jgi:hypothetical protein
MESSTCTTVRVSAGIYHVSDGTRVVVLMRNPALRGPAKWTSYAQWDPNAANDPVMTKDEAQRAAYEMLAEMRGGKPLARCTYGPHGHRDRLAAERCAQRLMASAS